MVREH